MSGASPTRRPRRSTTPSGSIAPPVEQHSFRKWAWTVADDVISLRSEFDSFRSRFGDRGDTSRGSPAHDAISTSRPGAQASNISLALSAQSPLPSDGGDMMAGRMLRAAADEVLAEVRDEHRTLRCSLEAEQSLLRQELETLRGQLRWYLHNPDVSRDDTLDTHSEKAILGKGRLDTMEEAILNLGREILSQSESHGMLEGAHRELQQRVEELREASNAIENLNCERFANLEQAQRQAESVLLQLQAASSAQTFGARDLSQDVSRVVETVEFRLQALSEEVTVQRRRTDDLLLFFSHAQSIHGRSDTLPSMNEDSIADSVRVALQANPRRQPSEATRMCRTFRAWLELVAPTMIARTTQAAFSNIISAIGQSRASGSSEALEQDWQVRLARTEQEVLAKARAEVLHHREELCRAVRLELETDLAGSGRSPGSVSSTFGADQLQRLGNEVLELRTAGEHQEAEISALNEEVRLQQQHLVKRAEQQSELDHQQIVEARLEAQMVTAELKLQELGSMSRTVEARLAAVEGSQLETQRLAQIEEHVSTLEARILEVKVVETRLEAGMEKSSLQLGTVQNVVEAQRQHHSVLNEELRELREAREFTAALMDDEVTKAQREGEPRSTTKVVRNLDGLLESCVSDASQSVGNEWEQNIITALTEQETVSERLQQEFVAMSEALSAQQETLSIVNAAKASSAEFNRSPEVGTEGAISPFSEAMEAQRETASSAVGEELRQMAANASKHSNATGSSRVTEELRQLSNGQADHVVEMREVVEQPYLRLGRPSDPSTPESASTSLCMGTTVPGTPTRFPWGIGGSLVPADSQHRKPGPKASGDDAQLQRMLETLTHRVEEALEMSSEQTKLRGVLDSLAAEVEKSSEERRLDMSSVCDELRTALSEGRQGQGQVESLSTQMEKILDLQQKQDQRVAQMESLSAIHMESLSARVEEVFEKEQKQRECVTQPALVPIRSPTRDNRTDNLATEVDSCRDEQRRDMSSVRDELKIALFEGRQGRGQAVKLKAEFEQACADLGGHYEEAVAEVHRELALQNAKLQQITADTQCCQASEDTLREEIYQVSKGLVELEDKIKVSKDVVEQRPGGARKQVDIVRLNEEVEEVKSDNAKMVNELASLAERVHEAAQNVRNLHTQVESSKETPLAIGELRAELTGTWEELEQWVSRELSVVEKGRKLGDSELQEEICQAVAQVQEEIKHGQMRSSEIVHQPGMGQMRRTPYPSGTIPMETQESISKINDELHRVNAVLQESCSKTNDEMIRADAEIQEHRAMLLTIQSDLKQMAIESHSRLDNEAQLRSDFVSMSTELHEQRDITASALAELKDVSSTAVSRSHEVVDTAGFSVLESRVRDVAADVQALRLRGANGYSPGPHDAYWESDRGDCWQELKMLTSEIGEQGKAHQNTDEAVGALSSALRAVELRLSDKERSKHTNGTNAKQSHGLSAESPALIGAMEECKAGVAELRNALCLTWEVEDAQALVRTRAHETGPTATSPGRRSTDDALLSRISELDLQGQRTAVTVEHMRASQHSYLQEAISLRESLAGAVKESEVAAQIVAREAETHVNARLSKALLETRRHLNSELSMHAAEMRTYIAERAAAIAMDWGSQREAQQALSMKLGADVDTLQRHLAEVVDDSVDMRKQVLTLCDSRSQTPQGNVGLHINELSHRLNTLSDDVSALSRNVAAPQSQQIVAIRNEVGASVVAMQGDMRRLSSQVVASEQNAQRGLSLMQRAVESLQDELHLLKQRIGSQQQG